jgi:hypothetical protein
MFSISPAGTASLDRVALGKLAAQNAGDGAFDLVEIGMFGKERHGAKRPRLIGGGLAFRAGDHQDRHLGPFGMEQGYPE